MEPYLAVMSESPFELYGSMCDRSSAQFPCGFAVTVENKRTIRISFVYANEMIVEAVSIDTKAQCDLISSSYNDRLLGFCVGDTIFIIDLVRACEIYRAKKVSVKIVQSLYLLSKCLYIFITNINPFLRTV
jgi:hypothetical protein